jgi:hypothetical protein
MSDSETLAKPEKTSRRNKTPEKAEYIKRNLKKDVSDGTGSEGSSRAKKTDYRAEFAKLKGEDPYKGFPAQLKTLLADPVDKALQGTDDKVKASALETFKKGVTSAVEAQKSWTDAAAKVSGVDAQVKHLERWKAASAGAMRDRVKAMTDKAAEGKFADAVKDLPGLEKDVPASIKVHYEGARKTLGPSETDAKKLGDNPAYLTTLRKAYTASAKVVDDFVSNKNYVGAVDALPALKKDAAAAVTGAQRAVKEQQTKTRCDGINNDLDKQIKFRNKGDILKKDTKVRDAVGSQEWKAAVKKIVETKLDDEFMDQFNTSAAKVIDELSKNPKVKEAHKKWATWMLDFDANKDKIQGMMQEVLKVQSEALGWPTPTAQAYSADDGDLGSFNGDPYPPGTLQVNFLYEGSKDFRELMDTVAHENTHAYQEKLIRGFRDGSIKEGDLEYSAAMMLEMNDTKGTKGYISGAKSKKYDKNNKGLAYKNQPCEAHAWGAGSKIGRTVFDNLEKSN